ncbi:hypothetical protein AM609_08160 [Actinomyces sp. oral taxon 414]|nr:hypothetical protein AM609_08160 [Actinomyces sp. oral taxon 414]
MSRRLVLVPTRTVSSRLHASRQEPAWEGVGDGDGVRRAGTVRVGTARVGTVATRGRDRFSTRSVSAPPAAISAVTISRTTRQTRTAPGRRDRWGPRDARGRRSGGLFRAGRRTRPDFGAAYEPCFGGRMEVGAGGTDAGEETLHTPSLRPTRRRVQVRSDAGRPGQVRRRPRARGGRRRPRRRSRPRARPEVAQCAFSAGFA